MMDVNQISQYLRDQIRIHIGICYKKAALDCFNNSTLVFTPLGKVCELSGPCVAIPIDLKRQPIPDDITKFIFNGITFTLYNKIEKPDNSWDEVCIDGIAVWYVNKSGVILPAWNHFQNIIDLFSFSAERNCVARDRHQRLRSRDNPYLAAGLSTVPVFNEFVFILLSCLAGKTKRQSLFSDINSWVKPLRVVLSHDCDVLLGNDKWSQFGRIARGIKGLLKGDYQNLKVPFWIGINIVNPRRYYMNNVYGMLDLERQFGFSSILYILNGSGGRFGFRNEFSAVRELLANIPKGWDVGLHYNYDTLLNDFTFSSQKQELEATLGQKIISGRAHYLKFNPLRSFSQLESQGINFDESLGMSDRNGYRNGIAGVFYPLLIREKRVSSVLSLPLQFWDSHLTSELSLSGFYHSVKHLSKIGGVVSLLFHPGQFHNIENPEMDGVYFRALKFLHSLGTQSVLPKFLIEEARKYCD